MRRVFIASVLVCVAAATANGQTKISGSEQCGKPDPQHVLPVGDRPDHSVSLQQLKCTWTKPMEIEGAKSKDGVGTETSDIQGTAVRTRGYHVTTMDSGDKFFASYQGTSTLKENSQTDVKGTWMFTGGTGKLKGLKGKGTFTCTPSSDGFVCEIEGEYQPAK